MAGRRPWDGSSCTGGRDGSLTNGDIGQKIVVMKKRAAADTKHGKAPAGSGRGLVAAAEFKATCLELMDRVRETGAEYVITKHGVAVARLVPYVEPQRQPFFGSMKGTVLKYEWPFDPIDGEYDINRD
jgi:prevent-host-death family protein